MRLDPMAAAFIAEYTIELRRGGASSVIVPLPEVDFAAFTFV